MKLPFSNLTAIQGRKGILTAMRALLSRRSLRLPPSGFTMIEIAIALAIIAFALVAIIGVLPLGMNVQKENREQTIINQDANFFMEAIRNGARGLDDLTNYVLVITNTSYAFEIVGNRTNKVGNTTNSWYTFADSSMGTAKRLTNGARIVGLLSTPKIVPNDVGFVSNFVVGHFRALNGSPIEKYPQTNENVLNMAFRYRMISELAPMSSTDTNSLRKRAFDTNLHELRLTFLWPLLPSGNIGNGRQSYRTLAGGFIARTNDNDLGERSPAGPTTYFIQPSTYLSPD